MSAFGLLTTLDADLEPSGIRTRGVVTFAEGEGPALPDGRPVRSVVLLGNVGGSIWPAFSAWSKTYRGADPLDAWSKSIIDPVAVRFGATAFYPSDPPYVPFQQWAMRAEGLTASPLGILVHPDYGLWHGYRGALAFREGCDAPAFTPAVSPCETCLEKPCLSACPAQAISLAGFAVDPCRSHLASEAGRWSCMASGCIARNACPVGAGHRYPPEQLAFHMDALFS